MLAKHSIKSAVIKKSSQLTCVFENLHEWTRRPLGIMILSLEKLAAYLNAEISRSRLTHGIWTPNSTSQVSFWSILLTAFTSGFGLCLCKNHVVEDK